MPNLARELFKRATKKLRESTSLGANCTLTFGEAQVILEYIDEKRTKWPTLPLEVDDDPPCPECRGMGFFLPSEPNQDTTCQACQGTGKNLQNPEKTC
jgi:hypothetical protein